MKTSIAAGLFLLGIVANQVTVAQDYSPSYNLIDKTGFYNEDLAVATYNILDYGVSNDGSSDCSAMVQTLLDKAAGVGTKSNDRGDYRNPTGGIVYFPEGVYLFKSQIVVPRGVTIRGDWKRPDAGSKIEGTIFNIQYGKNSTSYAQAFIVMQPSSLVTNLAFWYSEQNAASIVPYPATVLFGQTGYWGNDYCNVRHCTFINSYIGVQFNPKNGGGCPNIFDIYGTPLSEGIEMDCIADVGRFDGIDFSAKYWEGSGLSGSPSAGQIDSWLYNNAKGIVMRRNDWSYTCNYSANGYSVGFLAEESPSTVDGGGKPNGHNYGFELKNCKVGVQVSGCSSAGIMFTRVNMQSCNTGVVLLDGAEGPAQFYECTIEGNSAAVNMTESATSQLMFQDCTLDGVTHVNGGHFQAVHNIIGKNVNIGAKARTIFNDNRYRSGASLVNNSIFECATSHNGTFSYPIMPDYDADLMAVRTNRPSRSALYVVTEPEFGAVPGTILDDPTSLADCSAAIQKALDKAASEGGGIVYLPSGHYKCSSNLVIPTGVELKGSSDIPTVPRGQGAIIEVCVGEGNENGTPFISMSQGSGMRGLSFNYPTQDDPTNVRKYPYTIRGNADCYVVNVALRCAYRGLDLFTNKCDNHYVDYLAGHAFMNVVHIGGNSVGGTFANTQFNTIVYACGHESKFGSWPNSSKMSNGYSSKAYGQNEEDLDFLIVGDCTDEFLYNNFLFGCNKGMLFQSDGAGGALNCLSLGNAVDGAVNTFVINGIRSDLDLVNSQIVALNHNDASKTINHSYLPAYFITTGESVKNKVTFFSSDLWGGGEYLTEINGGKVSLALTNMYASGSVHTCKVGTYGELNIFNANIGGVKKLVSSKNSDEYRTSIISSVVDNPNESANEQAFAMWLNNLSSTWELGNSSDLESRTSWKATASNDATGTRIAKNAIDGVESTRWDTEGSQTAGQWFKVDFNKTVTLNTLILDAAPSGASDGPAAYTVEIYSGSSWQQVASGSNGGATTIVTFDEVSGSQVRVNQTGSRSNYWSIHEFYVGKLMVSGVESVFENDLFKLVYDKGALSIDGEFGNVSIEVYDMSGVRVTNGLYTGDPVDVATLKPGIYIAVARGEGHTSALKFVK